MTVLHRALAALLAVSILSSSCRTLTQSQSPTQELFQPSRSALQNGHPETAWELYPNQVPKGFVSTLEQAWLATLAGRPAGPAILNVSQTLESRKTIHVSDELAKFTFLETDDHYFPSEHEIVILHLVGAMSLLQQKDIEGARVEARRAGRLLQSNFKTGFGDFDDAFLRAWLATVWTATGDWEEARVDWRVAARLAPDDKTREQWEQFAASAQAPRHVSLVFAGAGPTVFWDPSLKLSLDGGLNSLSFKFTQIASDVELLGPGELAVSIPQRVNAQHWYARHQERDYAARRALGTTRELVNTTGGGAATVLGYGAIVTLSTFLALLSVGAGVGTFYLLVKDSTTNSGGQLAAYLALLIGGGGLSGTYTLHKYLMEQQKENVKQNVDPSRRYQYVRFLPEFLFIGSSAFPAEGAQFNMVKVPHGTVTSAKVKAFLTVDNPSSRVQYFHLGDPHVVLDTTSTSFYSSVKTPTAPVVRSSHLGDTTPWLAPNQSRWVTDGKERSYDEMVSFCGSLSSRDTAGSARDAASPATHPTYRPATLDEIRSALKDGIAIGATFGADLSQGAKVWLKMADETCTGFSFSTLELEAHVGCFEKRWPLCVSTP